MSPPSTRWLILLALTVLLPSVPALAQTAPQVVARQFREYSLGKITDHGDRVLDDIELPKTTVAEATKWQSRLQPDGSWRDIDYKSGAASSWPAYDHLTRVLSLTSYALGPDTPQADAAKCMAAVHRALAYWRRNDFRCPNWWYNDIGVPKILGNIALLLNDQLQPDERAYILETVLPRSKVGTMTGQNRVWLAGNGIMLGAMTNDSALIAQAARVIDEEIRVTTNEGIQPDWSFHQHGPQQQFGNYGMAYAVDLARWATVLRGTPYAFPQDKLAILRNYLLEGENWVAWRGAMDIGSCGRQLFPNSPRSKVGTIAAVMRVMALADPSHAAEYLDYVSRNSADAPNDLIGNRAYWRSDYVINRRPDWMASLKMRSNRVIGGESLNGENLSGSELADGATFFYRTGHEYDDIFPLWDWRKIPGTTEAQNDAPLAWPKKADYEKDPSFVGGASDGQSGCCAMDFRRDGVRAKKAWFFDGDVVVCLGADITNSTKDPVITTVNQCLLKGPVTIQFSNGQKPAAATEHFADAQWVDHDGLRYVFPQPEAASLSQVERTGNWRTVFDTPSTPRSDVSRGIFTLWIDQSDSYAYYVVPSDLADRQQVTVVRNSPEVQVVRIGSDWSGAVFWTAGTATLGSRTVHADQPCLAFIDGHQLTVADPTHQLKSLRLTVGDAPLDLPLPQAGEAGKSVSRSLTPQQ